MRHKRAPIRPPTLKTDIYVTRKSSKYGQRDRALKLFDDPKVLSINLKGMGAAIQATCDLLIFLQDKRSDLFDYSVSTDSVELVDDVVSDETLDIMTETRFNSSIHICITKRPDSLLVGE